MPELHPDADRIIARLEQEGVNFLSHFSRMRNLESICRSGALRSKAAQEAEGLWPCPAPGGNDLSHRLDRRNNNWDMISLNFTPHTPFAYRTKREDHLGFFIISPEVAGWSGVEFTHSNAAGTGDRLRGVGVEGLEYVDFGAIRASPRPGDRTGWVQPVQAEILVPSEIPFEYVREVGFVSPASRNYAEQLVGDLPHPPFVVRESIFADTPKWSGQALDFTHIVDCYLTDEVITRENAASYHVRKTRFIRGATPEITLVLLLSIAAGTTAEIALLPANRTHKTRFETSRELLFWKIIPMDRLVNGDNEVHISLGGVEWAALHCQVVRR